MFARFISEKGMRWFFAETLVIVVGVLIAIGFDDYWNERQNYLLEIDYIRRIEGELKIELRRYEDSTLPNLRIKRAALESILPVLHGQVPVAEDTTVFLQNVSLGGIGSASDAGTSFDTTFQDLQSTGNLRLISDTEVRAAIVRHYAISYFQLRRLSGRSTNYVSFVHSVIPAELRDEMDVKAISEFGADYAIKRILSDEFRNIANQEYNRLLFIENMPREDTKGLIDQLETYRSKLESSTIWL